MNQSLDQSVIELHHVSGGHLHAVSGPEFSLNPWAKKPTGYIIKMESGSLSGTWNVPGGLKNPHDIAVSANGSTIYAVELNPFLVWKLTDGENGGKKEVVPGIVQRFLDWVQRG